MATAARTAERAEAGGAEDAPILPNYIGGEWREAEAAGSLEDVDPASGRALARVPLSTAGAVDVAARAALAAQPDWAALAPQRRARAILKLRERLEAAREEIAVLVSRDMGKGIDQARAEVGRGLESVEAASAVPHLLKGASLEGVAGGVDVAEIFHFGPEGRASGPDPARGKYNSFADLRDPDGNVWVLQEA